MSNRRKIGNLVIKNLNKLRADIKEINIKSKLYKCTPDLWTCGTLPINIEIEVSEVSKYMTVFVSSVQNSVFKMKNISPRVYMYNSKQIDFSHYLLFSIQQLPITNNRLVNSAYQLNKNIQKLNMLEYGISEI